MRETRSRLPPWLATILLTVVAFTFLPAAAASQPALGIEALFPHRAALHAQAGELVRLDLPAAVFLECQPDLSDLRILDPEGRQVPYTVDLVPVTGNDDGSEPWVTTPRVEAVERQREDRTGGPPIYRETYRLALPSAVPWPGGRWELELSTPVETFTRQARVRPEDPQKLFSRFISATTSIFRLRQGAQEQLTVTLPVYNGEVFTLVLEGEGDGYLEPTFTLRGRRLIAEPPTAAVQLTEVSRTTVNGRTTLFFRRPPGLVPTSLTFATVTPNFRRTLEVRDAGHTKLQETIDRRVARATVFDTGFDAGAEDIRIALPATSIWQGDHLRLVIEDGDAPPLEELRVTAHLPAPTLFFAQSLRGAQLLFGGGRARAPRYGQGSGWDRAAALSNADSGTSEEDPEAAFRRLIRVVAAGPLPQAELGPIQANPAFDPRPLLAYLHHPGSSLDPQGYRYRRTLELSTPSEGLARLRLSAEEMARARTDLGDLRVVDEQMRQWPFLLQRQGALDSLEVPLTVPEPATADGVSRYRLEPPVEPLAPRELILEFDRPYFDRSFLIEAERLDGAEGEGPERQQIASGRLVSVPAGGGREQVAIPPRIELPGQRFQNLELQINDGNDAPLRISNARLKIPAVDLFLPAPPGTYFLLLGNATAEAPRYDLSRARDAVLTVASVPIEAGPLEENPRFHAWSWANWRAHSSKILLWTVLGLAVLGLAWLTLRVARQEPGSD